MKSPTNGNEIMKLPLLRLAALALQFHLPVVIAEPASTGQTVQITLDLVDESHLIGSASTTHSECAQTSAR